MAVTFTKAEAAAVRAVAAGSFLLGVCAMVISGSGWAVLAGAAWAVGVLLVWAVEDKGCACGKDGCDG